MPLSRSRRRPRGVLTGIAALAVAAFLLWHGMLPDIGGAASLVESFLPWAFALIAVLGLSALLRLSLFAGLSVAAASAVWWSLFGAALLPAASVGAPAFTVVSENLRAGNPQAAAIAHDLAARKPDLIALQELDQTTRETVADVLDADYPYSAVVGTVGLWSTHPLHDEERLDLGLGWDRALSVDVDTPGGTTRVYAVHLASVRPGESAARDEMMKELTSTIADDDAARLLVVGDFNTATTDRTLAPLFTELGEKPDSELGLGFTWPSAFPAARLDHALVRGLSTVSSIVLPANGSDHRGIEVGLR
ncbi:endonuclease/exonuclease/phosphatase family protein [Leifsonia aquatica]|uniref:Vancomycin resistance protein VanJ n=1 Tax=Leifsonia aquatica TaxID=144185 RepID=A0A7W4YIV4_LEIAQ|nr:endonuclease/exonuclease/phosphatase family protein [Leifsonia aquatica]MBB2966200.1 vancomycin resistance protein VanJ [Leifsonia aquatica]